MPRGASNQKTKPTVTIVGSGRLGTALALALTSSGYQIEALVARRPSRARRAASLIGSRTGAFGATQLQLLPLSKITVIATPDDQIRSTAEQLASFQKAAGRGRTVLHTSGALSSSDVLSPLAEVGFDVGSLHPLVSVSDPRTGSAKLPGAFYCVEGDAAATRVARAMVIALKGESFHIRSNSKPLYHAAAVMASGHVVALFQLTTEMLVQCGLTLNSARRVLLPLLESTVSNLSTADPAHALTGTFARGDLATVQRHLKALSSDNLFDALAAYKLLGRRSLELAREMGGDSEALTEIDRALDGASKRRSGKMKQ
ncbi:MAG: DUF2520 domain-containing protein [Acidobacteriota bacterium]